jgi:hypothetical protein
LEGKKILMPKVMAALAAAILLAACDTPSPSAAPASNASPTLVSAAPASSNTPATTTKAPPPAASCPSEHLAMVINPGDPMTVDRCVHEGTGLELTFNPVAGYRWSTVDSSDHYRCVVSSSKVNPDGTGHAVLGAVKSGEADITASLSPATDPHGPPTRQWKLHLRILPSPLPMG